MLRGARQYSKAAPRRVEGLTREQTCEQYRDKVHLIARRIYERLSPEASVEIEDLVSNGAIGLLEAFDRYDASRDVQFTTFAEYRIRGAIYDALRSHDTFSRRRRQQARAVEASVQELTQQLGRAPTSREIARFMDIDIDKYHRIAARVNPHRHMSLEGQDPDSEESRPLLDCLPSDEVAPESAVAARELVDLLGQAVRTLSERDQRCIEMYYGKDMSLKEIAAVYEVTVSRISQILSKARKKLRGMLSAHMKTGTLPGSLP